MAAVSIIIRTKNEAAWIGRTLEALSTQEFRDFEVIVVDSGSEDDTLPIVRKFKATILEIPAQSFTYGRSLNVGAAAAQGEFLVALSAHALPAGPSWLAELLRPLADPRVAAAASRQVPHPGHRLQNYLVFWQTLYRLGVRGPVVYRYLFSNACSVFRASLWRMQPFDEQVASCEDHLWALRMQRLGYRIAYCPEAIVLHSHKLPLTTRWRRGWSELKSLVRGYYGALVRPTSPRDKNERGSFHRSLSAGMLLVRAVNPRSGAGQDPSRRETQNGTEYDLYEPETTSRKTSILLYGMTLAGEREPRLVRLAQSFVRSGFRVAVPSLPGLKSLAFDRRDLAATTDLAADLYRQHGAPVGITGFSAGAGIALTAAAQPDVADLIDPMLLFGPYYRLSELWATWHAQQRPATNRDEDWDLFIWTQMVRAFSSLEVLDLDPAQRQELVDLLHNYCTEPSLRRKKEFYRRVLEGRILPGREDVAGDERTLDDLSPCGRLHRVEGRVLIVHDPADRLIPPSHSRRIMAELRRRGRPDAQSLLVTPVLSHVGPSDVFRLPDILRVLRLVGEIFRS